MTSPDAVLAHVQEHYPTQPFAPVDIACDLGLVVREARRVLRGLVAAGEMHQTHNNTRFVLGPKPAPAPAESLHSVVAEPDPEPAAQPPLTVALDPVAAELQRRLDWTDGLLTQTRQLAADREEELSHELEAAQRWGAAEKERADRAVQLLELVAHGKGLSMTPQPQEGQLPLWLPTLKLYAGEYINAEERSRGTSWHLKPEQQSSEQAPATAPALEDRILGLYAGQPGAVLRVPQMLKALGNADSVAVRETVAALIAAGRLEDVPLGYALPGAPRPQDLPQPRRVRPDPEPASPAPEPRRARPVAPTAPKPIRPQRAPTMEDLDEPLQDHSRSLTAVPEDERVLPLRNPKTVAADPQVKEAILRALTEQGRPMSESMLRGRLVCPRKLLAPGVFEASCAELVAERAIARESERGRFSLGGGA